MGLFNFIQHVAQGDEKPGGGVFDVLHSAATLPGNAVKEVSAVATGNPTAFKNAQQKIHPLSNPVFQFMQAIPRSGLEIGASIGKRSNKLLGLPDTSTITATNPVTKAVIGEQPVKALQNTYTDIHQSHGTPFALALTALSGASDLPIGGVGKGAISKTLDGLAKATDESAVRTILKGAGVEEGTAHQIAPAIAATKDPHIIQNIITKAHEPVAPVDTSVAPSIIPPEVKPPVAPVKPDAEVGQKTLNDLAMQSKDANEFHQKLQDLPEDPHVQAAFEKSNAQDIGQLYDKSKAGPFKEILDAVNGKPVAKGQAPVKGIESIRNEQNATLSQERGQRFAQSAEAGKTAPGSEGYFAEKRALKGQYSQAEFKPLISDLGPDRAEQLFSDARQHINSTPDSVYHELNLHPGGARLNTQTAVRKVLGLEPGLPTTSEIKLLKVYSPDLAKIANDARPPYHKLMDFAAKVFGGIRGLKATADLSMGGRQGIFVAARHPVEWALANKESVKYAGSGKYYKERMQTISSDPWVQHGEQNGLALQAIGGHEEQYEASDLLTGHVAKDKLKVGNVVAGASRAYDGGLTELRASLWKSRLMKYGVTPEEAAANLGEKGMKGLAEAVNTLTGRGGKVGGFIQTHSISLATTLFSPRLWASRLEPFNPAFWKRIGPAGRAEAFQNLASFASVASLVLGAAAAAGAEVETDPRSSDFLKIKVGDTRYDILGGFQQNLVFGWREISGEKKSTTSGAVTKFAKGVPDLFKDNPDKVQTGFGVTNRLKTASDLAGNKLSPVIASGVKLIRGTDAIGQPVNPLTEIGQLFVPISIQGSYQTVKDTGSVTKGILKNSPDFFGISSQTYGVKNLSVSPKQKEYIAQLEKDKAPADQIAATKLFFQTVKTVPPKTNIYAQIDKALNAGDQNKAAKLANDYNDQFDKAFTDWRKQYGKFSNDEVLQASYQKRLITDDELQQRIDKINQGG